MNKIIANINNFEQVLDEIALQAQLYDFITWETIQDIYEEITNKSFTEDIAERIEQAIYKDNKEYLLINGDLQEINPTFENACFRRVDYEIT